MFQIIIILVSQIVAVLCDENAYIGAVVEFDPINSYDLSSAVEVNDSKFFSCQNLFL